MEEQKKQSEEKKRILAQVNSLLLITVDIYSDCLKLESRMKISHTAIVTEDELIKLLLMVL